MIQGECIFASAAPSRDPANGGNQDRYLGPVRSCLQSHRWLGRQPDQHTGERSKGSRSVQFSSVAIPYDDTATTPARTRAQPGDGAAMCEHQAPDGNRTRLDSEHLKSWKVRSRRMLNCVTANAVFPTGHPERFGKPPRPGLTRKWNYPRWRRGPPVRGRLCCRGALQIKHRVFGAEGTASIRRVWLDSNKKNEPPGH